MENALISKKRYTAKDNEGIIVLYKNELLSACISKFAKMCIMTMPIAAKERKPSSDEYFFSNVLIN